MGFIGADGARASFENASAVSGKGGGLSLKVGTCVTEFRGLERAQEVRADKCSLEMRSKRIGTQALYVLKISDCVRCKRSAWVPKGPFGVPEESFRVEPEQDGPCHLLLCTTCLWAVDNNSLIASRDMIYSSFKCSSSTKLQ